jgi:hypothetical protein
MYAHHLNSCIKELEETLCILEITQLVVTEKGMGCDKYMDKIKKRILCNCYSHSTLTQKYITQINISYE